MSVINKMLRDLDQRGAAQGRVEGSMRGAGIPLETAGRRGRWKIAAWALMVPLVLAAGWIVLRPDSGSSDGPAKTPQSVTLAEVTPRPADAQKEAAETQQVPVPPQPAPEPSPQPQAPVAAVAPPAPVATPEPPAPTPKPQAPAVAVAPPAPVVKPEPPAVVVAPPPVVKPAAPAPSPQPQAPAVAAVPSAPVVKPPAPAPAPPLPASVVVAQASAPPEKPAERTDPVIPIAKKRPAATPLVAPEKTAPKTPVPAAQAKPPAPAPAADAGRAAAPAQDTAKGSISVDRQGRDSSRAERASAEYRSAVELMNQGRVELAGDAYAGVLRVDPKHAAARQALVALLMGRGRMAEAQGVLREGLAALPENTAWAMLLARLQIEGGDAAGALATLDGALPYAKNRPDYHAFVGTLLQMQGRHKEAIAHYEIAVRLSPDSGRWLTGLAISLEEEKRLPEAREAYQRALATNTLARDLQGFVERKLGQLR